MVAYKNDGAFDLTLQFNCLQDALDVLGDWFVCHHDLGYIVKLEPQIPNSNAVEQALEYLDDVHGIVCIDAME